MAKETIKFENAKSEELYNWVNENYPPEMLAKTPLFIAECVGVLKGVKQLGLNYEWIDTRMSTLELCMLIHAL